MDNENLHSTDETFLARWLAGELSSEEASAFEKTDDYKKYVALAEVSASLKAQEYDVEKELSRFKTRIEAPATAPIYTLSRTRFLAVAAVFCIAALTGIYYLFLASPDISRYQTAFGETQSITLPDGSTVILNTSSSLEFSEKDWLESRTVNLKGEAFFEVETGNSFTVSTSLGDVSVLGTQFNVKQRSTVFTATCFEGSVAVNTPVIQKNLSAGEGIQIEENTIIDETTVSNQDQPSWMRGIVTLTNVPLSNALEELSSQFGITVMGTLPTDSLRFTGSFPTNNSSSAVKLVLEPFNIDYDFNVDSKTLTIE